MSLRLHWVYMGLLIISSGLKARAPESSWAARASPREQNSHQSGRTRARSYFWGRPSFLCKATDGKAHTHTHTHIHTSLSGCFHLHLVESGAGRGGSAAGRGPGRLGEGMWEGSSSGSKPSAWSDYLQEKRSVTWTKHTFITSSVRYTVRRTQLWGKLCDRIALQKQCLQTP